MKKTILLGIMMTFLLSCQKIKVFKKSEINIEYRETVFKNASMKKAIEDVASNFGRRDASVVFADNLIIVCTSQRRMEKVEELINSLKTPKQ